MSKQHPVDPVFAVFVDSHAEVLYPGLAGRYLTSAASIFNPMPFRKPLSRSPINPSIKFASSTVQRQIVYFHFRSLKTVVLSFRGHFTSPTGLA